MFLNKFRKFPHFIKEEDIKLTDNNYHIRPNNTPPLTREIFNVETKKERRSNLIDPRAVVHEKAEIGENVAIGPFTIIEENVRIGAGTRIASNVLIASGTRIGKNCQIHHGAVLGTLPQYIGFDPAEVTTLEIGDETIIREYCTLNRGTEHRQKTVVGSHCYLMAYTHVGHDGIVGNHVILANAVNLGGHVVIEDYAGIGGIVPVHQFVRIGCHSFIGGGYRVTKDVPPYILASGDPLTFGGLNTVGLTRRGFSQETLRHLKRAYKIIYRSNLNVSQAITRIREELEETEEIKNIIDFIESSERGIIR